MIKIYLEKEFPSDDGEIFWLVCSLLSEHSTWLSK